MSDHVGGPTGFRVEAVKIDALESMEEAAAAFDWELEYRQLQAGKLAMTGTYAGYDGIGIVREEVNQALEVVGSTPPGEVTIHTVIGGEMIVNGQKIETGVGVLVPAKLEMELYSTAFVDAVTLHITERDLMAHLGLDSREELPQRAQRMKLSPDWASRALSLPKTFADYAVTELIGEALHSVSADTSRDGAASAAEPRVPLARAREFVDEFSHQPIRMPDLARHAGVSLRTLERAFRRALKLSPTQYIRARRLNNVRQELTDPTFDHEPISAIATTNGFSHLGWFAHHYRAHYGETARETRQSRAHASIAFSQPPSQRS